MSDSIYKQKILDYIDDPINSGQIKTPDLRAHKSNPLCGDEVDITIRLDGDVIKDIKFSSKGCAISKAYASMATELVQGKTLKDIRKMTDEDIVKELNICLTPARLKCALLGFRTIKKAADEKSRHHEE